MYIKCIKFIKAYIFFERVLIQDGCSYSDMFELSRIFGSRNFKHSLESFKLKL